MKRAGLRTSLLTALLLGATAAAAAPDPASADPHRGPSKLWRGRIGIRIQPMTEDLRAFFEAPAGRGVLVSQVEPDRPAARAGLAAGDVVVAVGGEPVARPRELIDAVRRAPEGEALPFTVIRRGESLELSVQPEGGPPPPLAPPTQPDEWMEFFERGMELGSRELRLRIEQLERRLEELEKQIQQRRAPDPGQTS